MDNGKKKEVQTLNNSFYIFDNVFPVLEVMDSQTREKGNYMYLACFFFFMQTIYLILTLGERLMPRVTGLLTADTWPGNINLDLRQIKWIK